MKTISLDKGEHRFIFRYEPGSEAAVRDVLVDKVYRRQITLDDARWLTEQMWLKRKMEKVMA